MPPGHFSQASWLLLLTLHKRAPKAAPGYEYISTGSSWDLLQPFHGSIITPYRCPTSTKGAQ